MIAKLLLVEDDPGIQRLYERLFKAEGFDVSLAEDGTFIYETIMLRHPDIIIMDVMMPNFNGIDTLQELKSKTDTQNIPIVMISANDNPEIVQKALRLGAARYLFKDQMQTQEIVQAVKEVLNKHQT